MSFTDQLWEQGSAFPDLQFVIGADEIRNTSGVATLTLNASGDLSLNIGASQATVNVVSPIDMLRTGRYGSTSLDQTQFGTAAVQPGPSSVANTSGPLALQPGFPPVAASKMGTVAGGSLRGPIPKGIQINSLDLIYLVSGAALTTNQVGVTATTFSNNAANVVTNLLAKATNGLQTAIQANPYVTNVPITAPAFTTTSDTQILIEWDVTTQVAGSARLYGIVLRCSFNFN